VVLFSISILWFTVLPQFDYHKSYPHWTLLWGLLSFYPTQLDEVSDVGMVFNTSFIAPQPTHPLETVCVLLLDLVVALAKFLLVLFFSVEEALIQAYSLSWQPSLRAFPWWSLVDVFPLLILTFSLFSRVGKPILGQKCLPGHLHLCENLSQRSTSIKKCVTTWMAVWQDGRSCA